MYYVTNDIWVFDGFAVEIANNGERDDAAQSLMLAPGNVRGDADPLLVVYTTSNGAPTYIGAIPADYPSYGHGAAPFAIDERLWDDVDIKRWILDAFFEGGSEGEDLDGDNTWDYLTTLVEDKMPEQRHPIPGLTPRAGF